MKKILEEVTKQLPSEAMVSDTCFEGANIIVYTKNASFFLDNKGKIREIVNQIKKRIELRPDPSLTLKPEKAKKIIEKIFPKESNVSNIIFDEQRSRVIIEAEKPGSAIGKNGENLKAIKEQTLWVPLVKRTPGIRSPIIENIRNVLYENSDYRRKFLNKVGQRIYSQPINNKREKWVRISFLGASREVGRSCFLIQTQESKVILDCGVNVAAPDEFAFPYLNSPEVKIEELDAIILSHSHTDHCGAIPFLYKMGFKGPIYLTAPTRDVSALLLLDYIGIAQKEGKPPLFGTNDVKEMVKHSICLNYEEVTDITPDIRLTFYNAGHILGSSLIHLNIGNGFHNFLYTGDFNYEDSNLLSTAISKFPRLESVMMESTYASSKEVQYTRAEGEEKLTEIINETAAKKGKILMPVLGVGRAQEVMLIVEKSMREGKIPKMPVYIQGMLWDVTAIHTTYPDFFNPKIKNQIFQKDHNPFLSDIFVKVGSQKEMKKIIEDDGPYIVMATSGMMTGGASVEYFKAFAENPKNTLVFTCYQGAGSLGRRLEQGEKEIGFLRSANKQEILKVLLRIETIKGFSGHSSWRNLNAWVKKLEPRPRKIIAVHGEQSRCIELASNIYKTLRIETISPHNLDAVRLR